MKPRRNSHRSEILIVVLVGLIMSLGNAVWAFLLSISETLNGNFALVSLFISLGLLPLVFFMLLTKREKIEFDAYAAFTGVLYGISNIVLLSIFSYRNSAVVYSLISPTVLVFIVLEVIVNRSKIKKENRLKLLAGGGLAGFGFILLSLNGLNFSLINTYDIAISVILIVLYGAAGFFYTQTGLRTKRKYNSILNITAFEIFTSMFFLSFYHSTLHVSGLPIAFLAGLVVSIGVVISFIEYGHIKEGAHAISYSSIIYVLSEMETLFLLLFYSIFVGILNPFVIVSVLIIAAAVWYLSRESNAAFD